MTDQYPHERSAKDRENSDGEATPEVAPFEHGGQPADVADPSRDPAREDHAAAHGRPTPDAQAPEIARTNAPAPGAHTSSGEHAGPFPASRASYGVGPFSVREVALLGVWVVAFFVSFFRTNILDSPSGVLVGGGNVWLSGLWWIPAVAVPTVAVGLVVLRRLSPQGIRRVGSLGIDQFASVAFTVSALVWVSWVWDTVAVFNETGIWTRSWVIWVEAVVLLVGVALTVFAPFIPPFSGDFRDREEVPAHRNARPIRPVTPRPRAPRAPRPVPSEHAGGHPAVPADAHADHAPTPGSYTGSTDLAHDEQAPPTSVLPTAHGDENDTDIFAPLHGDASNRDARDHDVHDHDVHDRDVHDRDARDHDIAHGSSEHAGGAHDAAGPDRAHAQAFWALAPEEREIVDDYGTPIFRIGPTAWALVIEDRGETFVVRHDDGRIGYLHDVSGVTRG